MQNNDALPTDFHANGADDNHAVSSVTEQFAEDKNDMVIQKNGRKWLLSGFFALLSMVSIDSCVDAEHVAKEGGKDNTALPYFIGAGAALLAVGFGRAAASGTRATYPVGMKDPGLGPY